MALPPTKTTKGDLSFEALSQLGFREYPFSLSADPRFLYLSTQHNAVLQRVEDLINWRQGLAVVEGQIGVGKTTIARRLYEMHVMDEENYNIIYIHTAEYASAIEATRDISGAFGRRRMRANIDQLRDFEAFLLDVRKKNQNAVVIIDDAQKMSADALNAFQNFLNFDVSAKLIQIILFGQPEIHVAFGRNEAVLDRVSSWQRLSPLPSDEALNMIKFRSVVAGREDPLLTDSAFLLLYEFTKGVPRPMIIICGELLHILSREHKSRADTDEMNMAIKSFQERHPVD
jgi:general secretion pathway protein A